MIDILPANQVVELLADDTHRTVVGYGFAAITPDAQQEQRWLLLPPHRKIAPPNGTVHLRKAQSPDWAAIQDIKAFASNAQATWDKGSQYVRANCFRQQGIQRMPSLKELAAVAPPYPPSNTPPHYQTDTGTIVLRHNTAIFGYILSAWHGEQHLSETWVLFHAYPRSFDTFSVTMAPPNTNGQTFDALVNDALSLSASSTATLVLTSCTYESAPPSP